VVLDDRLDVVTRGIARLARGSMVLGVILASTRYRVGDVLSPNDVQETREFARSTVGLGIAAALEAAFPGRLRAVATPAADVKAPTTVGLGDTFAAGFLLRHASSPSTKEIDR
jgi:ADP-dependent phosphofructokinase/glucokinase